MAAALFTRRIKNGLFSVIRDFSSSCTVIGKYHNVILSCDNFEPLPEYLARCPPVTNITPGRLISINPARTLESNDNCRHLLWSSFLQSVYAKKRGLSLAGVYHEDNMGVIEEMGILAFRNLVSEEATAANKQPPSGHHQEFALFAESFLCKNHGPGTLLQLPEWDRFLRSLMLPDEQLIYDSVFFPDNVIAMLFFDAHRLLKHELPCRTFSTHSTDILWDIHSIYSDSYVARICSNDPFLSNFLGAHKPAVLAKSILGSFGNHFVLHPPGSAVVDVNRLCYTDTPRGVTYPYPILVRYTDTDTRIHHFSGFSFKKVRIRVSDTYCIGYPYPYSCNVVNRHAITHAIEDDVIKNISKKFPHVDPHLLKSYTREELIRKLRYDFDCYAQGALDAFWKHESCRCQSWSRLEMSRRLQIPDIFFLTSSPAEQTATNS